MARSWLQRVLFGADGSVVSSAPPDNAVETAMRTLAPPPKEHMDLQEMQKALGLPVTPKEGDNWKGVDWDEEQAHLFFAGDKPTSGHPGAGSMSYQTLRAASGLSIIAPFVMKRIQQMIEFSRPQANRYAYGAKICLREDKPMTRAAEKSVRELWDVFNRHEPFHVTMAKWASDSWPLDQAVGEILYERGNRPYAFRALDAATIRRGRPRPVQRDSRAGGEHHGSMQRMESTHFVQMIRDRVQRVWSQEELLWIVRRPRTNLDVFGYGYPEIQQAYDAITAYLAADDYNNFFFKNGMHASGILQVFAKMDRKTWSAFRMMMTAQLKGVENAHRLAMVLLDGSDQAKERIEKVDLGDRSNREMEFSKLITMKIQVIASNFNMSPKEVGLPEYSDTASGGIRNESGAKEEILLSRKYGLLPALVAFEDVLNERIVKQWDEDFQFKFVYDDETEASRLDMAQRSLTAGVDSTNEQRKEMDRPVIDRKFLRSFGVKMKPEDEDKYLLAYNLPMTSTIIQALSVLGQAPPDQGLVGTDGQPVMPQDGVDGGQYQEQGQQETPQEEEQPAQAADEQAGAFDGFDTGEES